MVLAGHRISFIGWSLGDRVRITGSDGQASARPDIRRHDVADALGGPVRVGFEITLPMGDGRFRLGCECDGTEYEHEIEPVTAPQQQRATRRLALRFALVLLRSVPSIARAMMLDDARARDRVKHAPGDGGAVRCGGATEPGSCLRPPPQIPNPYLKPKPPPETTADPGDPDPAGLQCV